MSVYTPILDDGINVMGSGPEPAPDPPTVLSVSPDEGSVVGGSVSWNPYTVTITGEGFGEPEPGVSIMFGGKPVLGIGSWTDTEITGVIPPTGDDLGPVDVTVTPAGGVPGTLEDGFTYIEAPPMSTLESAEPSSGPLAGGTQVTLTGTGFSHNLQEIKIGNNGDPWDFEVISDTEVVATSSPRAAEVTASFFITTAGGQNTSTGVNFSYLPVPTASSLSPSSGSEDGGYEVTLTGTGWMSNQPLTVTVDGNEVDWLTFSETSVIFLMPAGTGEVPVVVTTNGGTSDPLTFTYEVPAPTITGVSPSTGLTTGGEVVDVTGSNLGVGGLMVTFGGAEVTSLSVNPEGTIATVTTPAASEPGQVEVEVTTNGGSASLPEGFTYEEPEPDPEA